MVDIHAILKKYWGYDSFRPLQEDIVRSILAGKDTLALLPTGGGKSICFQVPALAMEGVCIVISPLIALMKDQVENLKQRNIAAEAIYSGLHIKEIENILSRCEQNEIKFLYLSPERLKTKLLCNVIAKMNVSLLAVDESHCISQWGYDFRPPYLEISEFRKLLSPTIPVLALTATATPEVVRDIQYRLNFREQNVFQKSFARPNLTYFVFHEENKINRLFQIVRKVQGTGIVYVRSRKRTVEIAKILTEQGFSADFYHAGLDIASREQKQEAWKQNKTRIIVATNAFGMGIDKPDVRFVVHMDIPDNLEAYFQEAGRGGRDEKTAYAIMLYENADLTDLAKKHEVAFPPISEIINIYDCLCNYFKIPIGEGDGLSFDFNQQHFAQVYHFSPLMVHYALVFLEKSGLILQIDASVAVSKLNILMDSEELRVFQQKYPQYSEFIKLLLRTYQGLFSSFVPINEAQLALYGEQSIEDVKNKLQQLQQLKVIFYQPQTEFPKILFLENRQNSKYLSIEKSYYKDRKMVARKRLDAVFNYVKSTKKCRSRLLLEYFGEKNSKNCEKCDACLQNYAYSNSEKLQKDVEKQIKAYLQEEELTLEEIQSKISENNSIILKAIRYLLSKEQIYLTQEKKYKKR